MVNPPHPSGLPPAPAPAIRLLVVDDDGQILELLELSLSLQGFQVWTALSGFQALELAVSTPFDVIVMDVLMSPLDGFETVRRMAEALGAALPPVVYLSGLNREEEMPQLHAGHKSAFLVKPFRPSQLAAVIREMAFREE